MGEGERSIDARDRCAIPLSSDRAASHGVREHDGMVASSTQTTAMASGMSVAVSGMRAEQYRFDAAANNIANADTPGYNSEQVLQSALPGGGVETNGIGVLPGGAPTDVQTSNVDLGEEMAGMMVASSLYGADAKVVTVQGRMDQSLLNVLA